MQPPCTSSVRRGALAMAKKGLCGCWEKCVVVCRVCGLTCCAGIWQINVQRTKQQYFEAWLLFALQHHTRTL